MRGAGSAPITGRMRRETRLVEIITRVAPIVGYSRFTRQSIAGFERNFSHMCPVGDSIGNIRTDDDHMPSLLPPPLRDRTTSVGASRTNALHHREMITWLLVVNRSAIAVFALTCCRSKGVRS